jgi:hypothetical protein
MEPAVAIDVVGNLRLGVALPVDLRRRRSVEHSRATAPATSGEAIEVPDRVVYPVGMAAPKTLVPGAAMLGFTKL